MATQKPISTISYNTEGFLKEKLESWYHAHIIQGYMYILHIGEDGDKNHIHVWIDPNRRLDVMDLAESLKEYDKEHPSKPLGCLRFQSSKVEDWLLYAVHDAEYLQLKYDGGDAKEKLPYEWTDIKAPEGQQVELLFARAKASIKHTSANLAQRLASGESALDAISKGENVYLVNSVLNLISRTEYTELAGKYEKLEDKLSELQHDFNRLYVAVVNEGYTIAKNDKEYILIKEEDGSSGIS